MSLSTRPARCRRSAGPPVLVALACLLLAGCVGLEPFDYTPIDSIPPGPGLFSGADGVFTVDLGGEPGGEPGGGPGDVPGEGPGNPGAEVRD